MRALELCFPQPSCPRVRGHPALQFMPLPLALPPPWLPPAPQPAALPGCCCCYRRVSRRQVCSVSAAADASPRPAGAAARGSTQPPPIHTPCTPRGRCIHLTPLPLVPPLLPFARRRRQPVPRPLPHPQRPRLRQQLVSPVAAPCARRGSDARPIVQPKLGASASLAMRSSPPWPLRLSRDLFTALPLRRRSCVPFFHPPPQSRRRGLELGAGNRCGDGCSSHTCPW